MSLQRFFVFWVFVCSVYLSLFRLPRRGLPRPYRYIQANWLPRLQGYHTRATTLHTNFCWVQAGYHTCGGVLVIFPFIGLIRPTLPQQQPQLSTEPGAHRTDAHNTTLPQQPQLSTEPGAHRTDPLNTNNDFQPSRIKSRQDRCFGQQFSAHLCSCDRAGAVVL